MRGALLLATIFLCASVLPIASAHDPPPDATGIIFSLSGDGGDFSLIRQEPSSASQGSRLINSGGSIDLGTWTTDPLTSPLVIENTEALVVVYALPVGIVIGAGMHISVRVMVDGEEIQSGDSETIILNEPLWTNIPWTSEEFDISAQAGQVIEINIAATIEGAGAARVQWGDETDSPSIFSLQNWYLDREESLVQSELTTELTAVFTTPWDCTDIDAVSFEIKGPVADHDIPWAEVAEPVSREVSGEDCTFTADLVGLDGTYLHRWQVLMSDGSLINRSGYFELEEMGGEDATQPFTTSLLGGVIGLTLITIPLIAQLFAIPISLAGVSSLREINVANTPKNNLLPLLALATIGLVTGLLTTPILALFTCIGLLAISWAIIDL